MSTNFDTTIAHAGISFFSFLNAKDLAAVSFCSKGLYNETRQHVFNVCRQQLPIKSHDDDTATDTLNAYWGDEKLTFPESKQAFLSEILTLLHQNEVRIEDNGESLDQLVLAKQSSFLKLVSDDGLKTHFSLGFKRRSFKSRTVSLLHASEFADDRYLEDETEKRVLIKQWIYLLTSLDCVSVCTWHAMFVFESNQSCPVGGAGMIFNHKQTGESIEVVRRMSKGNVVEEQVVVVFEVGDGPVDDETMIAAGAD